VAQFKYKSSTYNYAKPSTKSYLHWLPCLMDHIYGCFYLCLNAEGAKGRQPLLLPRAVTGCKRGHCKLAIFCCSIVKPMHTLGIYTARLCVCSRIPVHSIIYKTFVNRIQYETCLMSMTHPFHLETSLFSLSLSLFCFHACRVKNTGLLRVQLIKSSWQ
jgi:hypothetical protein